MLTPARPNTITRDPPRLVAAVEAIHKANETEPGMGVLFSARMRMMAQAVLDVADRFHRIPEPYVERRATEWRAVEDMTGSQFVRWACYWKGERPTDHVERRSNEDWGPRP